MSKFGSYIKQKRDAKGLTLNQVALYSDISAAQLSRIETGKRGVPKPATIKKISEALKEDYEELMKIAGYLDDSPTTDDTHKKNSKFIQDRFKPVDSDKTTVVHVAGEEIELSPKDIKLFEKLKRRPILYNKLAEMPEKKLRIALRMVEAMDEENEDERDDIIED